jgi:hypothetical protein
MVHESNTKVCSRIEAAWHWFCWQSLESKTGATQGYMARAGHMQAAFCSYIIRQYPAEALNYATYVLYIANQCGPTPSIQPTAVPGLERRSRHVLTTPLLQRGPLAGAETMQDSGSFLCLSTVFLTKRFLSGQGKCQHLPHSARASESTTRQ